MKTLLRIAAVLSFGCCFAGGLAILGFAASGGPYRDSVPIAAVGLVVIGMAFFVGSMIWLAAEKCCTRKDGK